VSITRIGEMEGEGMSGRREPLVYEFQKAREKSLVEKCEKLSKEIMERTTNA